MKKKRETNQHNTAKNNNTQFIATIDVHVFVEMLNRKKHGISLVMQTTTLTPTNHTTLF